MVETHPAGQPGRAARRPHRGTADCVVRSSDGSVALNSVIELMRDMRRPRADMWEVAVWEDALAVDDREVLPDLPGAQRGDCHP